MIPEDSFMCISELLVQYDFRASRSLLHHVCFRAPVWHFFILLHEWRANSKLLTLTLSPKSPVTQSPVVVRWAVFLSVRIILLPPSTVMSYILIPNSFADCCSNFQLDNPVSSTFCMRLGAFLALYGQPPPPSPLSKRRGDKTVDETLFPL